MLVEADPSAAFGTTSFVERWDVGTLVDAHTQSSVSMHDVGEICPTAMTCLDGELGCRVDDRELVGRRVDPQDERVYFGQSA